MAEGRYVDTAFLLSEGITLRGDTPADQNAIIAQAENYVDRTTHQYFDLRSAQSISFDGSGTDSLDLPVPLVECDSITIDGVAIDLDGVIFYGQTYEPGVDAGADKRMHPRIEWDNEASVGRGPRFTAGGIWPRGKNNIVVTGDWGFVDKTGDSFVTPRDIKRATAMYIDVFLNPLAVDKSAARNARSDMVVRERSGRHSATYSNQAISVGPTGNMGIDLTLARYTRSQSVA